MKKFLFLILLTTLIAPQQTNGDVIWFDDFESYQVGTSLADNGYIAGPGDLNDELIDNSGVNGSQGFDVLIDFPAGVRGQTGVTGQFFSDRPVSPGDVFKASVDTQIFNAATVGQAGSTDFSKTSGVGFSLFGQQLYGFDLALFLRGENFDKYSLMMGNFDEPFEFTPERPIEELGLSHGVPMDASDVLNLELTVRNTPVAFFLTGKLSNESGLIQEFNMTTGFPGIASEESYDFWTTISTGDALSDDVLPYSRVTFDNFLLTQSIPEPVSGTLFACVLGLLWRRRARTPL